MVEPRRRLILIIGLPYSGKTNWATSGKEGGDHGNVRPIVNPDSIRLATHGQRYAQEAEGLIWAMAKIMVRSLFFAGHTVVVVDACHTHKVRRDFWKDPYWKREYIVMDVAPEACMARALNAGDNDILESIKRMALKWDLDGVYYGQDGYDEMAAHIVRPGPDENQIYHIGTAKD